MHRRALPRLRTPQVRVRQERLHEPGPLQNGGVRRCRYGARTHTRVRRPPGTVRGRVGAARPQTPPLHHRRGEDTGGRGALVRDRMPHGRGRQGHRGPDGERGDSGGMRRGGDRALPRVHQHERMPRDEHGPASPGLGALVPPVDAPGDEPHLVGGVRPGRGLRLRDDPRLADRARRPGPRRMRSPGLADESLLINR